MRPSRLVGVGRYVVPNVHGVGSSVSPGGNVVSPRGGGGGRVGGAVGGVRRGSSVGVSLDWKLGRSRNLPVRPRVPRRLYGLGSDLHSTPAVSGTGPRSGPRPWTGSLPHPHSRAPGLPSSTHPPPSRSGSGPRSGPSGYYPFTVVTPRGGTTEDRGVRETGIGTWGRDWVEDWVRDAPGNASCPPRDGRGLPLERQRHRRRDRARPSRPPSPADRRSDHTQTEVKRTGAQQVRDEDERGSE